MENRKWLKRKYPKSIKEVNEFLNDEQLDFFKKHKYKIGRLTENIRKEETYVKGSLCMFKRSNPINSYNYPLHTIIIKCDTNLTESGYNNCWVTPNQVEEVIK